MKKLLKAICISAGLVAISGFFVYYSHKREASNRLLSASQRNSDYYLSLRNFADFLAIQGSPLSNKFNDVLSVKVVFDVREGTLYFTQSRKYRYHHEFCREVLGDSSPLEIFNMLNYGGTLNRKYLLANLNYYTRSKIYGLEFVSEDRITPEQIKGLVKSIKENSYLGDSLNVLISSDYLLSLNNEGKLDVKKVFPSDIYNGQRFQLLNAGVAYGTLRMAEDLKNMLSSAHDILVFKGTPANVPVCAGILTNSYQTPLSHINILCHNRKIPSAVDIDILNNKKVRAYLGKPVKMVINNDSISITLVSAATVDSFWKNAIERKPVKLNYNITWKELIPAANIGLEVKNIVGNKAAGYGELYKVSKKIGSNFLVPEGGFAIPFYFYSQHVSNHNIKKEIDALAVMKGANASDSMISVQLKRIRKAIKEQPLDAKLLSDVNKAIVATGRWKAFRFRSSSNAEDMDGFSGAGLYESKTGILNDTDKPVDMAIKKVWASAWNDVAYNEREAWHIDENSVMMGILAHRSFPDEKANGVAITKNLYRPKFPGFTVNVQVGEVPVVSPPDSVTCEQFVCMNADVINILQDEVTIDYITYSNINNGKTVLSKKNVARLYNALAAAHKHYARLWAIDKSKAGQEGYALDIEFKFDSNGILYLKQARPYR